MGSPHAMHQDVIHAEFFGQGPSRPVSGIRGSASRRFLNDLPLEGLSALPRPARTRRVLLNPGKTALRKALPPQADGRFRDRQLFRDLLVLQTVRGTKDNPSGMLHK